MNAYSECLALAPSVNLESDSGSLGIPALPIFARRSNLRRIGARTIDALWKAIGDITRLYSEKECWNFFKHEDMRPENRSML